MPYTLLAFVNVCFVLGCLERSSLCLQTMAEMTHVIKYMALSCRD